MNRTAIKAHKREYEKPTDLHSCWPRRLQVVCRAIVYSH
ncbi:MAG TPA: hypothetical protein DEQ32_01405 [Gammaproteobacteria bacterium]|nr:hypothetical protein [Gammaproteobacteria bacterium]